jgi:hypothetical protein
MPRANQDNIKQWLDQSDIDYFTHFVKAWIPFNAWYRNAYDTLKTEREILDEVKHDGNRVRSRFTAKLEGADPESEEIRNQIAALHRRLSSDPLMDRNGKVVSLEKVLIGPNPLRFAERKHGHWTYRVERLQNSKNIVSTITSSRGRTVCAITQNSGWNIEEFEILPEFVSRPEHDKGFFRQCYDAANPQCFGSLLAPNPPPSDALLMDGYHFLNDRAAIFAGLIEVLYCMRNMLFHGELVPDSQTNRTYEPGYHLVRHLTRCIV